MKTSYPKDKIKVLLLEGVHPRAISLLKDSGYTNIEAQKGAMTEEELLEKLTDVHLLGIRSKTTISKKVLDQADRLLAIGAFCIGTNQIDLQAAMQNGVAVFNSPYSNTRSVAELVIAEIIMLFRRVTERSHAAHNGQWLKDAERSYEVRGKTLGIIGYGHIGSQVSILAEGMGMKVQYYDIEPKLPLGNARPAQNLNELLSSSDVVTLHVPGTAATKNMIGKKELDLMKKDSLFLNLSRGDVVELESLKNAIENGKLSGCAVDVFPDEPVSKAEPFHSILQGLPNTILTPHIGGSTIEAQENIGIDVANKLIQFTEYGASVGSKSIPRVSLPVQKGTHRILHIHKNRPGIMSAINKQISEMNINVAGQYLTTNEEIGYVVLDIEKEASKEVLQALKQIEHTIKARILY